MSCLPLLVVPLALVLYVGSGVVSDAMELRSYPGGIVSGTEAAILGAGLYGFPVLVFSGIAYLIGAAAERPRVGAYLGGLVLLTTAVISLLAGWYIVGGVNWPPAERYYGGFLMGLSALLAVPFGLCIVLELRRRRRGN